MTLRERALMHLKDRRPYEKGSAEWNWRTRTAWKLLQWHWGKPICDQTSTPPKTTIGA